MSIMRSYIGWTTNFYSITCNFDFMLADKFYNNNNNNNNNVMPY